MLCGWLQFEGGRGRGRLFGSGDLLRQRTPPPPSVAATVRACRIALVTTASICSSSTTTDIDGPSCGCRSAGTRPRGKQVGKRRCIGLKREGEWLEFTLGGLRPLNLASPVATSATLRPTRLPVGQVRDCPPNPNGNTPRSLRADGKAILPRAVGFIRVRRYDNGQSSRADSTAISWQWTAKSVLRPYPGFVPPDGRTGRVQRQVHVQPVRAARRFVRDASRSRPRDVPKLLSARARWQFSAAFVWHAMRSTSGRHNRLDRRTLHWAMLAMRFASVAVSGSCDSRPLFRQGSHARNARYFQSFAVFAVVSSLDLSVAAGEIVVLLGPSGCGKTTILRMVAGLETPSDGQIVVDSVPLGARRSASSAAQAGIRHPGRRTVSSPDRPAECHADGAARSLAAREDRCALGRTRRNDAVSSKRRWIAIPMSYRADKGSG